MLNYNCLRESKITRNLFARISTVILAPKQPLMGNCSRQFPAPKQRVGSALCQVGMVAHTAAQSLVARPGVGAGEPANQDHQRMLQIERLLPNLKCRWLD
jgi:hypothetical protein